MNEAEGPILEDVSVCKTILESSKAKSSSGLARSRASLKQEIVKTVIDLRERLSAHSCLSSKASCSQGKRGRLCLHRSNSLALLPHKLSRYPSVFVEAGTSPLVGLAIWERMSGGITESPAKSKVKSFDERTAVAVVKLKFDGEEEQVP